MPEPEREPAAAATTDFHFVKTPWWRWNLATLAGVLFVFVWIREAAQLPPSATWFGALSLIGAWLLAPVAVRVDFNSLADSSARACAKALRDWRRKSHLGRASLGCRFAAALALAAAVLPAFGTVMTLGSMNSAPLREWPMFSLFVFLPIAVAALGVAAAVGLWLLGEACLAIDRLSNTATDDPKTPTDTD